MTSADILTSKPMRAADTLARPSFDVPAGACDAHVHVFESEARYPHVAHPHYTLPDGPLDKLDAMCASLGLARYVIVQPSFYGTDNRCMLDALDIAGERARGVAMVADDIAQTALQDMHLRGVRALRLDLFLRSSLPTAELVQYIQRSVRQTQALGWHLQFYTPGWVVRDLIPYLGDIDADFVIDHMGYMLESDGLTRQDFDRLLRVLADGRGWMKLSGPYRVAKDGNYDKLRPLAHAIVDALPERTIWGSDWPHIPEGGRDTGELLNLLASWVPGAHARRRILVDNPARLFGFGPLSQ
jgi:predicted TIM-barrel fold metal-dependent hydrolase